MTPERHAFLMTLRPMDLVRVNGKLRVIRRVHRRAARAGGREFMSFTFSILRCSWTHQPYTVINMHDLAAKRIELVARNWTPKTARERLLQTICETRPRGPKVLDCCDVKGIP